MRKTTARIIAVAAALALTTAALTTIAVAAAHAPIADIVIGVVTAAQPTTVRRQLCKLPVEPVLRRGGLQLPPQGRLPVRPMPPPIRDRALRRLRKLDLPLQLVALPHAAVAAAAAAAAADISADRDDSITMPGALQASLRIRPPPLAFLDGADVPGWLRTTVIILLTLLTFS